MPNIFDELKKFAEEYDENDTMPEDTVEAIKWINEKYNIIDEE